MTASSQEKSLRQPLSLSLILIETVNIPPPLRFPLACICPSPRLHKRKLLQGSCGEELRLFPSLHVPLLLECLGRPKFVRHIRPGPPRSVQCKHGNEFYFTRRTLDRRDPLRPARTRQRQRICSMFTHRAPASTLEEASPSPPLRMSSPPITHFDDTGGGRAAGGEAGAAGGTSAVRPPPHVLVRRRPQRLSL